MPLSSDALSVVLRPGAPPVMVTEYMPGSDTSAGAQVINTATSGTVWLGRSSSLGASNGVPVDAGASVQWTQPGQLWAVLDQAATDPVTLIVSDRISSWTPSPEAVAIATATELVNQGVPNVGIYDLLYQDKNGGKPESTLITTLDVHKYSSLQFVFTNDNGYPIVALSAVPAGDGQQQAIGSISYAGPAGADPLTFNYEVVSPTIDLYSLPWALSPQFAVYGTNRVTQGIRPVTTGQAQSLSGSPAAGTLGPLLVDDGPLGVGQFSIPLAGPQYCELHVGGSTKPEGILKYYCINSGGNFISQTVLYDTQMVAAHGNGIVANFTFYPPPGLVGGFGWQNQNATGESITANLSIFGS